MGVLSLFFFILSVACSPPGLSQEFLVVIDPGHGGADHGTERKVGTKVYSEKTLALAISLATQKELKRLGIKSELTRNQDMDLPLAQRTSFANRKKANLFLSIHLNSKEVQTENAEGVETYILNHTSDATSKRLAELENNSQHPSPLAGTEYNKMTPDSNPDIALILKDLSLDANFSQSKALACSIQSKMSALGKDRGVRQAMFYVLLGADMPCALLEVGFLSNQSDFKKLINPASQSKFATAIAKGIEAFKINQNQQHPVSNCKVR